MKLLNKIKRLFEDKIVLFTNTNSKSLNEWYSVDVDFSQMKKIQDNMNLQSMDKFYDKMNSSYGKFYWSLFYKWRGEGYVILFYHKNHALEFKLSYF